MKQIIIWVLALGMCSINVSAQTKKPVRRTISTQKTTAKPTAKKATQQGGQVMKFKQVAEDGYVWYKLKRGNLYGAGDAEGNNIIPIKYDDVKYECSVISGYHFFEVKSGEFKGAYTRKGTCVISTERHYSEVNLDPTGEGKVCWIVIKNSNPRNHIVLDARGKELFSIECTCLLFTRTVVGGNEPILAYFEIQEGNGLSKTSYEGICDLNGKIVLQPEPNYCEVQLLRGGKSIYWWDKDNNHHEIHISYNSVTDNDYLPYENLYYPVEKASSNSSSSSASSSSSSSSSSNNTGGSTTTIVVEQQHIPQPFQEWQQCTSCWGSGNCRNCAGSGTNYIGSNLRRCSMCGGSGRCTTCSGQGGKNIIVYR